MKRRLLKLTFFILVFAAAAGLFHLIHSKNILISKTTEAQAQTTDIPWPMAGANQERTSWTAAEIPGGLTLDWYRTITPYIPPRFQIIAANNSLYISSAKGLYALNSDTGAQKWVFPTELPLGNSPTYMKMGSDNMLFVGGQDHKLYKIKDNGTSGYTLLWTFEMGINSTLDDGEIPSGYDTNPLVINNIVYMGNRNGYVYAVNATNGSLIWKFPTGGRINFSIAASSDNNTVYAVSNDTYAYALKASTCTPTPDCQLIWKSSKLPTGDGFQSWWPVVHMAGDALIISSSRAYRAEMGPDGAKYDPAGYGGAEYVPNEPVNPPGRFAVMDNAVAYFDSMPHRRVYYFLNLSDGKERVFHTDATGKQDFYPPLMNMGTNNGTRPPAVIGMDKVTQTVDMVYTFNNYTVDKYGNGVAGWKLTDSTRWYKVMTPPAADGESAGDEPMMYSASGNKIYYTVCCDRRAGYYDTVTNSEWRLFDYDLGSKASGYDVLIDVPGYSESGATHVFEPVHDTNGVYGYHGDQNPPIPYKGRLYLHRGNSILAFGTAGGQTHLTTLAAPTVSPLTSPVNTNKLESKLEDEVKKIVDAGHLRPAWGVLGTFGAADGVGLPDRSDYFHDPADTIYTLSIAYSYITDTAQNNNLKTRLATYLQNEMTNYSPCSYGHIGWGIGAAREDFTLPPEILATLTSGKSGSSSDFTLYAIWKYAQNVKTGALNASSLLTSCMSARGGNLPSTSMDSGYPFYGNARIAGYVGYCGLQKLANNTDTCGSTQTTIDNMMASRASGFNAANPWGGPANHNWQSLAIAQNFLWMTPELAKHLYANKFDAVNTALNNYRTDAPYWFVSKFEATYRENDVQHLFDNWALFAMKAWFAPAGSQTSQEELAKYLDAPAFARGDLYFIQNLVTTIEATASLPPPTPGPSPSPGISPTPSPTPLPEDINGDRTVNAVDLRLILTNFIGSTVCQTFNCDVDGDGKVNLLDAAYVIKYFGQTW